MTMTIHEVLRRAIDTELIRESPPTPNSAAIIIAGDNGRIACTFATHEFLDHAANPEWAFRDALDLYLGNPRNDLPDHPPVDDYGKRDA